MKLRLTISQDVIWAFSPSLMFYSCPLKANLYYLVDHMLLKTSVLIFTSLVGVPQPAPKKVNPAFKVKVVL